MQVWHQLGLVFCPDGSQSGMVSHAALPYAEHLHDQFFRFYFSSRDQQNRSSVYYLDYDMELGKIIYLETNAVLGPGKNGFFDSDGSMLCQLVTINEIKYAYYQGWNLGVTVPFRNAIGLGILEDRKITRVFKGPILDRSPHDPCFVGSSFVIRIKNKYVMYYLSCFDWAGQEQDLKHLYNIKIAESDDGLTWHPTGKTAIDFSHPNEYAISVPRVIFESDRYKMWYSYRGSATTDNYRIGYAESQNGYDWKRMDEMITFNSSYSAWNSAMQCYPCIFDYRNKRYMLYNGNDYGRSGFGIAMLEK